MKVDITKYIVPLFYSHRNLEEKIGKTLTHRTFDRFKEFAEVSLREEIESLIEGSWYVFKNTRRETEEEEEG